MKKKRNHLLYRFIRFIGKIFRSKTKKNPMEPLGKTHAYLYENTADKVLDKAAFKTVNFIGYKKGKNPALGSALYTITRIAYGLLAFVVVTSIIGFF